MKAFFQKSKVSKTYDEYFLWCVHWTRIYAEHLVQSIRSWVPEKSLQYFQRDDWKLSDYGRLFKAPVKLLTGHCIQGYDMHWIYLCQAVKCIWQHNSKISHLSSLQLNQDAELYNWMCWATIGRGHGSANGPFILNLNYPNLTQPEYTDQQCKFLSLC